MHDIIKALKINAEVLEEKSKFYAEHVPSDLHQLPEQHLKGAILSDVAHGYRETALRLEKISHGR